MSKTQVPVLLWPFWALWRLVTLILELTGRLLAVMIGLVLVILGALISFTIVGALVGVPVALLGILLMLRGLF